MSINVELELVKFYVDKFSSDGYGFFEDEQMELYKVTDSNTRKTAYQQFLDLKNYDKYETSTFVWFTEKLFEVLKFDSKNIVKLYELYKNYDDELARYTIVENILENTYFSLNDFITYVENVKEFAEILIDLHDKKIILEFIEINKLNKDVLEYILQYKNHIDNKTIKSIMEYLSNI